MSCGNRQRASWAITLELNSASASSQQDGRAATVRPSAVLNARARTTIRQTMRRARIPHSGGLMPRWYGGVSAGVHRLHMKSRVSGALFAACVAALWRPASALPAWPESRPYAIVVA